MHGVNIRDFLCGMLTRKREPEKQKLGIRGFYNVLHLDKDGKFKASYDFPNDIVNQGKNDLFDTMFYDRTPIASTSWFIGLISSASYSALAAADTMSSHSGWTEFTGYSQANRVAWGPGASASQVITNASPATFDLNASGTVKGVFVTTQNTKGGTTGRLWSTGLFSADVPVTSGDQLRVTYSVTA